MASFKVHKVAKAKAPEAVLPGSSNGDGKVSDKGGYQAQKKRIVGKPPVPGSRPTVVLNSNFERNAKGTASSTDLNHNKRQGEEKAYCYAGIEFRPLHVTDEGGISTPISSPKKDISSRAGVKPHGEIFAYEEVDIPSGNFDKINPESILVNRNQTSVMNNSALAAFTTDMDSTTQACQRGNDDSSSQAETSVKKPPPMPKPYSKLKEGGDVADGGKKRTPPPLPKPYNARKEEESGEANKPSPEVCDLYAVVQKPLKPKDSVDKEKEKPEDDDDDDIPPPLPSRPDFETQEDLKKFQEDVISEEVTEQSKGVGIIKSIKKHIRQLSDGSVAAKKSDEQQVLVDRQPSIEEISSADDKTSKTPKAYLVTDIINRKPSTDMFGEPEMYEAASDVLDEDDSLMSSNGLPDGWNEVKDAGGTYYWHVASGTTQWEKPRKIENGSKSGGQRPNANQQKPKPKPELKTGMSFPVHSMGWLELEESQVAPHNMSDTIAECISNLANQRKDLWKTAETWNQGKDLRLLLETDNLKLVDVQNKATLLVQPISKMRVWGAGREELKDFAYVARDQTTGKHKCHVFRCHGTISGRAIHNKLHVMCNKILAEKKKARENQQQTGSTKQWSDILNTPPKPSLKDQAGFNVKPLSEAKKSFSAKYIGKVEISKPSGIAILQKAISQATSAKDPSQWRTCLIEITVSSVRSTDCSSQQLIAEDRIKFVSFIGVANDFSRCGYITSSDQSSQFMCHVFQCIPNAYSFTKALEEACRLRLQSCLDTNPELAQKLMAAEAEKAPGKDAKPTVGIKGFLGKLASQTKLGGRRCSEPLPPSNPYQLERSRSSELSSPSNQYLIKYYGYQPVSVGTGPTPIKEAVKASQGTTLQITYITVGSEGLMLDDSLKSGLSQRHIPSEKISFCGLASDRAHFGVVESQGGGKFICHVFAEYKSPVNALVEAINKVF